MVQVSQGLVCTSSTAGFAWVSPMLGWEVGGHPFKIQCWFNLIRLPGFSFTGVPLWCLALPVGAITVHAWRVDVRARRAAFNLCPKCDYDRTGLAAGAVCPECGAARFHA
jgi:hypothetical protein